jgi:NAD(P)-dependent dehydrogenase (short-subunit alcohol dehydrogenase family)
VHYLITGVSRGLGRQLALDLLSQGHAVVGLATRKQGDPLLAELLAFPRFTFYTCDVSRESDVQEFMNFLSPDISRLDVAILNAASLTDDIVDGTFAYKEFRGVFEVNLFGAVSLVEKILPVFERNGRGMFVGISSVCARKAAIVDKIAYCASKAALNSAFEGFRLQLSHTGIRFLIINASRMKQDGHLLSLSYEAASKKIRCIVAGQLQSSSVFFQRNVFELSLVSRLFYLLFAFLPEYLLQKVITKFREHKGAF